jgi:hypothetical protein
VSLDVHINGQPIGFRVSLREPQITRGRILTGTVSDLASSDDVPAAGTTELSQRRARTTDCEGSRGCCYPGSRLAGTARSS